MTGAYARMKQACLQDLVEAWRGYITYVVHNNSTSFVKGHELLLRAASCHVSTPWPKDHRKEWGYAAHLVERLDVRLRLYCLITLTRPSKVTERVKTIAAALDTCEYDLMCLQLKNCRLPFNQRRPIPKELVAARRTFNGTYRKLLGETYNSTARLQELHATHCHTCTTRSPTE